MCAVSARSLGSDLGFDNMGSWILVGIDTIKQRFELAQLLVGVFSKEAGTWLAVECMSDEYVAQQYVPYDDDMCCRVWFVIRPCRSKRKRPVVENNLLGFILR